MFLTPNEALSILEHYKYFVIFPITVIEGPIISVIGGFLVYLGYLNGYVAYFMLAFGDLIGDGLHYYVGRYYSNSPWFKKTAKLFGYTAENEKIIEEQFKRHPGKIIVLSKASHGVGGLVQVVAGMSGMIFFDFMKFCLLGTLPKTLFLFLLGYYIGNSYQKIDLYFDRIAFLLVFLFLVVFVYFYVKRVVNKKVIEK